MHDSGLGCHVGHTFTGAPQYVDDIAIIDPSISGLRQMVQICEQYAMAYSIVLHPVSIMFLPTRYILHFVVNLLML